MSCRCPEAFDGETAFSRRLLPASLRCTGSTTSIMIRLAQFPKPSNNKSARSAYAHASTSVDLVQTLRSHPVPPWRALNPGSRNSNSPNNKSLQPPADVTAESLIQDRDQVSDDSRTSSERESAHDIMKRSRLLLDCTNRQMSSLPETAAILWAKTAEQSRFSLVHVRFPDRQVVGPENLLEAILVIDVYLAWMS